MSIHDLCKISLDKRIELGQNLAKKNGHRLWTKDDISRLKSLYLQGLRSSEIAIAMGRSHDAVRSKLSRLCFSKYHYYNRQEDFYIRRYYGQKSLSTMAAHLGVSVTSLVDRATKKLNLKHRYSGENSHMAKLSDDDVELIRTLFEEGLTCRQIAEKFEISSSHVANIVNYRSRLKLTFKH
ncbi:Uncharacterized protein conserved in bacteria [Vibrio cincinnatiensis]|uniref:GcrA cell cycle regulator n=1 Tax=Vibrio cincinnatiensis DSM 19608 TaxID=1123491 RepID=A0A1T4RLN5_VIBCI|nr:hypothetical protein [Vibrio cincinnatiensis]SKA16807.1 GcrA cell cycle regulator [Vibrio cincinnatiensis DSM 19608]SUP48504.1 Uncharacterized protein conserved in bacteria [Vibrio cincinnatiensis]SUP48509.1 Uncharacterized protein conserved in bacteria [Vibrio cincinnatiensis]